MDNQGLFPVIFFTRGPWYWVQNAYALTAILFSNILFLVTWYRKRVLGLQTLQQWVLEEEMEREKSKPEAKNEDLRTLH